MTDADPAIDSAIKRVYENTRSLHCIYHINQNLPKNLKAVLGNINSSLCDLVKVLDSRLEKEAEWNRFF
ncbi:23504_t:CDS:2, partial [Gigaspora margarita]